MGGLPACTLSEILTERHSYPKIVIGEQLTITETITFRERLKTISFKSNSNVSNFTLLCKEFCIVMQGGKGGRIPLNILQKEKGINLTGLFKCTSSHYIGRDLCTLLPHKESTHRMCLCHHSTTGADDVRCTACSERKFKSRLGWRRF